MLLKRADHGAGYLSFDELQVCQSESQYADDWRKRAGEVVFGAAAECVDCQLQLCVYGSQRRDLTKGREVSFESGLSDPGV